MPRVLYKIDPEEKAEHQNRYTEEYEEIESKLIIHPESKVLKPFDRVSVHEDLWPTFEFEDVVPIGPDGKIANLLLSVRDGHAFKITGRVNVDPDLKHRMCTFRGKGYTTLNGSFIELKTPDNISIGFNPSTCWIGSKSGWFEVKPALSYREAFERIQHIAGFFFLAVDTYEDIARGGAQGGESPYTVWEDVDEVLMRYVELNGSGVAMMEVIGALRESKEYLLEQFRKLAHGEYYVGDNRTFKWTDNNVYRWIVAGCSLEPPKTLPPDPVMAKARPPPLGTKPPVEVFRPHPKKSPTPTKSSHSSHSPSPPTGPPQQDDRGPFPPGVSSKITFAPLGGGPRITIDRWPRNQPKKPTSNSWVRRNTAHHGVYTSPEFPHGIQPDMDIVEMFVVIGCHARICDRFTELNASNLSYAFYWDYKCDENGAARQVMNYYAKQIAAKFRALGPSWKDTAVYKGLLEAVYDDSNLDEEEKKVVKELTVDGKKAVHRSKAKRTKVEQLSEEPTPANLSTPLATMSIGGAMKRKSDSPPAAGKRSRPKSVVSRSRDPSPVSSRVTKYDSVGKVIPKPIKRSGY